MKTPFNVLAKHNSWDKAPRDPITIGNAIIAGLGMSTSYISVIWLTGFVATTLIAGALMRALMPKPPKMQEGLLGNFRQAAAPWDVVYGQVRKGGTITYMESTGDTNKYLHMIVTLAGHEVEEIGDIYINDKVVTIDGNDEVTSEPWVSGAGGADKWITIKKFTGASNQNIYNSLQSMTDGPTFENEAATNTPSNFKGEGISCIYVRLEYNRDVFASGIPSFSAVVKGKKVYDPRTSTTGYSANAALCIRDYLVSEYGLNTLASSIDDTYFSTAANDCNTSSGSGESNKFEINGVISTGANIRTNLQDMVGACVGNLYYSAGQFKLVAGVYSPSVKTLTLDDLRSEISLNTRTSRRDNFNSVQGTFIWGGVDDGSNSGGDWTEFEYPPITSAAFVTEDNEYDNPLQLDLPLTTGSATAQRIAKQTLFRAREQMSFSAEFGMNAFDLEIGDTVSLTLDRYGWDEKEFEVVSWGFKASQDAGDLRVTLGLRETSAAAFAWDAEESDIIGNNSNLPSQSGGLTVTNVTVADKGGIQEDGTFIGQALVSWTKATNSFIRYYGVEWKDVDETSYQIAQADGTDSSIIIGPLETGTQYDVRVRAITSSGFNGSYASALPYTHGGDTTAPSPVTSLSAVGGPKNVTLDWTAPTTDSDASVLYDLKGYNVYRNTSNSQPASPVAFSGSDKFVDGGLAANTTYYYWVKAVDYSGNESTSVASGAVTTDAAVVSSDTRIYTGVVYYQTLQQSQPSTPSASSFNESTLVLGGLSSGWSESQPSVEISSLLIKEWSSKYKVEFDAQNSSTIIFATPSGAFQVTDDLESDNYAANTSGWKLERDTGDIEVNSGLFRGDITVRGDISFTNDSHTSALVGGPFGHVSSSSTVNSYLDGAGLYVFVMVGGGGAGTLSDTDETSQTAGGGGGGGCAIFSFDWNGSTSLYFARGNGGTIGGGIANAGTASTFSYGGSIIATANGGAGAPNYNTSGGTASGGTVSFNTGVVTLLSNIGRTGGSATVSAGQSCAGAAVNFFGDGGANTTGGNFGTPGGSPYGQYPSTSDTRLIMGLDRTFGFIGGGGSTNNSPDSTAYAGDGGLFSGGGSVRSSGQGEAGDGGIGGGGGGARCDSSRVAGVGGPGALYWSKL
jgi:hypothetical protein